MQSSHAAPTTERPAERLRASVQALLGVIFVVVALLGGAVLWWHHSESLEQGRARAENLAHILAEHLGRTVASFDNALLQLSRHSQTVGGPHATADAWTPALKATLAGLAGAGSVSVIDETGTIVQSTIPRLVGQRRADRFLYRRLAEADARGLVADTPYRSVLDGHFVIPLGRRLVDAGGRFAGVIAITLEPERLRAFYRSVDTGAAGITTVLHPAGQVLFQEPSVTDPMGRVIAANAVLSAQQGHPAGFVQGRLGESGGHYLTAYRQLDAPPIIVAVSLAQGSILADWWREAIVMAAGLAVLAIVLGFAAWRLTREIRARAASQRQLADKVRELESTIAERDQAFAALSEAEARFRVIMDQAPVAVYVKDRDGRFTFINRAFETWTGVSAAQALGKTAADFLADGAGLHEQHDGEVIAKGVPIQREAEAVFPAGKRVALYNKFPIFDAAGRITGVGAIAADVTTLKHLESQLLQSQKMEAIGQLTGGIAHDFNNLLTAILLNADILASRLDPQALLQPLAQTILEAGERGADLTKRLLAFSRRQMLEARPADVNALIVGMENLMRRTLGEHITISLVLPGNVQAARIDPGQLETAILNLAVNARDAMPGGGRLTIETANAALDDAYAAANVEVTPGNYVMVAVTDTGTGMPEDVASRAFEPFFTTKEVGKGTGLGLSMVYGFVKQSNGHVKIYSEASVGTCVKLYLPCADAPADVATTSTAPKALPGGTETILLVEDDRLVRNNTEAQLRALGYTVVTAETAADAIEKIDGGLLPGLLFTDVVMPGRINGFELARRLKERLPGLHVLLSSGYSHGAALETDEEASAARHFLGKPFRRHDLAVKVREALDDPALD